MVATKLTLTKLEQEVLSHRLAIPDAIGDALGDNSDYDHLNFDFYQVGDLCDLMITGKFDEAFTLNPELAKLVLVDAVEGGTFMCDAEDAVATGEISKSKYYRMLNACRSLAKKVSEFTGEQVEYPER